MAETDHFAAERSPHKIVSSRASDGHCTSRYFTNSALIQAALLGWLVTLVIGASCLFAGEKGLVTGIVDGPSQAPIPGAKVTLVAVDGSRQSVVADQGGHYSFPAVEPGTYTLSAEAAGYQTATPTAVQVAGGISTTVDLHLVATASAGPAQTLPALPQPGYYDDTPLRASAVKTTIDAAGYSSQAQSPQRLMSEGPSLTGSAPRIPARVPGSPDAVKRERELQEALRNHPDSFEANHQLGEFYLSVNDFKTGIPYLEKAQKLKPEDGANGYDLAAAYLETKSPGPARSVVQDMLRRKDTAELHNLLGEADEALGDSISADERAKSILHQNLLVNAVLVHLRA